MKKICLVFVLLVVCFFAIRSISRQSSAELYLRENVVLQKTAIIQEAAVDNLRGIKIDSINKTVNGSEVNLYLVFTHPSLLKDSLGWRMNVSIDVSTIDQNNNKFLALTGSPLQKIDEVYSYQPDSGSFIFNVNAPRNKKINIYKSKFIINDNLSGKKDEKVVSFKL